MNNVQSSQSLSATLIKSIVIAIAIFYGVAISLAIVSIKSIVILFVIVLTEEHFAVIYDHVFAVCKFTSARSM